jgi:ubiquinone/menaquinone biosynthesis C-methylase UbiE
MDQPTGRSDGTPRHNPFVAAVYDWFLLPLEELSLRKQRHRIGMAASGEVLEIGAGTGAMLGHYGPAVTRVVATDVDPHMLRRMAGKVAHARVPVEQRIVDAQRLPFADESFDTVVSTLSLCTIPDAAAAVREARRVLRADGRLLFLEHVRSGNPRMARVQALATPLWRRVAAGCHLDRDSERVLRTAGFDLVSVWRSRGGRGSLIQGSAAPEDHHGRDAR